MNINTVHSAMVKRAGLRSWIEGIFPASSRPLWVDKLLGNVLSAQDAADAQAKGLQELRSEWIRLGKPKVDWKGDATAPRFSFRSNLKYVDPREYVKNLLLPTIRSSSLREAADKALDSSPTTKIDLNPNTNGLFNLIDTKP